MGFFPGLLSYVFPLIVLMVYIGIPVVVILFLIAAYKMVKIMKERNEILDRLIHLLEEQQRDRNK